MDNMFNFVLLSLLTIQVLIKNVGWQIVDFLVHQDCKNLIDDYIFKILELDNKSFLEMQLVFTLEYVSVCMATHCNWHQISYIC